MTTYNCDIITDFNKEFNDVYDILYNKSIRGSYFKKRAEVINKQKKA